MGQAAAETQTVSPVMQAGRPAAAANMLPIAQPPVVQAILAVVGRPSPKVQRRLQLSLECCENIDPFFVRTVMWKPLNQMP